MGERRAPIFAIFSGEHRAFWRQSECGYTADPTGAGTWHRHRAERMIRASGPEKMLAIVQVRPPPPGAPIMDAETLNKLAERCEAASGPDRELDGNIWWATRTADEISHLDRTGFVRECIERDGSAAKALAQFFDSSNPACLARVAFQQAYTASLDAALTLVPEGHDALIRAFPNGKGGAHVYPAMRATLPMISAATPALALTAACLRGLATKRALNAD